jgi:hypothetical protein
MLCVYERKTNTWHAITSNRSHDRHRDSRFQPVACRQHDGAGIIYPGRPRDMEPTCLACRETLETADDDDPTKSP